jgi:hypothetical protein
MEAKKLEVLDRFHRKITELINKLETRNRALGYGNNTARLGPFYSSLRFIRDALSDDVNRRQIITDMRNDPSLYFGSPNYSTNTIQLFNVWRPRAQQFFDTPHAFFKIDVLIAILDGMEERFLNDIYINTYVANYGMPERETLSLWARTLQKMILKIIPSLNTLVTAPQGNDSNDDDPQSDFGEDGPHEEEEEEEGNQEEGNQEEDIGDEETKEGEPDEGPKCNDIVMFDEFGIKNYLRKNPKNFVIGLVKPSGEIVYECQNLGNFKLLNKMDSNPRDRSRYTQFHECKDETPERFQGSYTEWLMPNGRIFVKMHSYKVMVLKPDWLWDGPIPEPRVFILEPVGDVYKFVTSE